MELYPAVDVRGGRAVRLAQGDFGRQRDYGDPLALARRYAEAGARWVHVVDLDAARTGVAAGRAEVLAIARETGLAVQAGGGVRDAADAEELFAGGVARVVVGTAAVTDPGLVRALADRHPGEVAVGLDHRAGELALWGWERAGGRRLSAVLEQLAALHLGAVVVTSIERDGVLEGPDLAGLEDVLAQSAHPVIASGGVRSVADIEALGRLEAQGRRLAGVVIGRALVDGTLGVEEAIAACAASA